MIIETLFVSILVCVLPFSMEFRIKLVTLYALTQILVGRYQGKSLLFYDEVRLLLIGFASYLFSGFLVIPSSELNVFVTLHFIFVTILAFVFNLFENRYLHIFLRPIFKKNVMIIGTGHTAQALYTVCKGNRYALMDPICFIDCNESEYLEVNQEYVVSEKPIYKVKDVEDIIDKGKIDTVLLAIPQMSKENVKKIISKIQDKVLTVKYLPQVPGSINFDSKIEDFDGLLMISSVTGKIKLVSRFFKRAIDIITSLAGMVLLIPLTIFVYLKNRSEGDKDPIFFTQERIGKNGKTFKIYKFRTMIPNAEKVLKELMEKDPKIKEEYTKNKKLVNDPRITKAGKFLREKSLDEFPQFINVFLGQMSLIGEWDIIGTTRENSSIYAACVA